MFFRNETLRFSAAVAAILPINFIIFRKEQLSPTNPKRNINICNRKHNKKGIFSPFTRVRGERTTLFASLYQKRKGSLTVEAAVVVSLFLLCMVSILQYANVMESASRFGGALTETSEKMAIAAYFTKRGESNPIFSGVVSDAYGRSSVLKKAGDTPAVENVSFLYTSYLRENDMVHLVMTYRLKIPFSGIVLPKIRFIQRASVRGWTGRAGSEGNADGDGKEQNTGTKVYVTEYGKVYHTDRNCSHIRLSIQKADKASLGSLRNQYGKKYKCCEFCGKKAGSTVYITSDGDRYHSSLECGGLKRTVKEVDIEELGNMRPCSKCGKPGH